MRIDRRSTYGDLMSRRRFSRLATVTTIAVLGLSACGSHGDAAAPTAVDRQASLIGIDGVSVCVSRSLREEHLTVDIPGSTDEEWGRGPFELGLACGQTIAKYLTLRFYDSTGTNVLSIEGHNGSYGYPQLAVSTILDGKSESHNFMVNEPWTYKVGGYTVRAERWSDTTDRKVFRVWLDTECPRHWHWTACK